MGGGTLLVLVALPHQGGTILSAMNCQHASLVVGKKGRVVIPASVRKEAGISEGSELTVRLGDHGQVVLESKEAIKKRIRARSANASIRPDSSVVDELLAERRTDQSLLD